MKVIEDIYKKDAERLKKHFNELKPDWIVNITEGDYNQYKLGFVEDIPCSVSIEVSDAEIEDFLKEIYEMETDAYIDEELLYIPSSKLNETEKERKRIARENLNRYEKYSWLEGIL